VCRAREEKKKKNYFGVGDFTTRVPRGSLTEGSNRYRKVGKEGVERQNRAPIKKKKERGRDSTLENSR